MSSAGTMLLLRQVVDLSRIACEIGLLAFLIYSALLFVKGTRSAPILAGLVVVALLLSFASQFLGLEVIEWLLVKMWTLLAFSVLIIFQPEIRRAFAELGSRQAFLRQATRGEREMIDVLVESTCFLADRRIGALVVVEKDIGLRAIAETGTMINAPLSFELLTTFFFPHTPLHDGGVIVHNGVITAAGCIFPLTEDAELSRSLGTRHRAGVGITEQSDAVVIIVSEESGAISLASRGRLVRGVNRQRLERHLVNYLVKKVNTGGGRKSFEERLARLRAKLTSSGPDQKQAASS